jgi:FixJ family two-component response regulator
MTDRPLVHVVDDDTSFRNALSNLLQSVDLDARTYGTVDEFIDQVSFEAPGCVVLDVRLPGTSGLALHEKMGELGIPLPVIMVTGHGDIPMTVRAMKAGAIDFLPKPFREQELLDAVDRAIESDMKQRAKGNSAAETRRRFASLSPRERQVMQGVVSGQLNKQVAADLGLSEITVKIHRAKVMQKTGAKSLADLVRMADLVRDDDQ